MLAYLFPYTGEYAYRVSKYIKYEDKLKYSDNDFPMTRNGIKKFENDNDLQIYIFAWDEEEDVIYPWYVSKNDNEMVIDLLIVPNESLAHHFALLRDLEQLLHSQKHFTRGKGLLCRNCLCYIDKRYLEGHKRCKDHRSCQLTLPKNDIMRFKNHRFREPVPV